MTFVTKEQSENKKFSLRLEQLYPFPKEALLNELARFPEAEVVWCRKSRKT